MSNNFPPFLGEKVGALGRSASCGPSESPGGQEQSQDWLGWSVRWGEGGLGARGGPGGEGVKSRGLGPRSDGAAPLEIPRNTSEGKERAWNVPMLWF